MIKFLDIHFKLLFESNNKNKLSIRLLKIGNFLLILLVISLTIVLLSKGYIDSGYKSSYSVLGVALIFTATMFRFALKIYNQQKNRE